MPQTKNNILRHELIGLNARVIDSKNKKNLGIAGKIIDETHHTLQIKAKNSLKRLFKKNILLEVELPSGEKAQIICAEIEKKPWERLKNKG